MMRTKRRLNPRTRRDNQMRSKLIALGIATAIMTAGQAFAENPPLATHMEGGPELVSFRVWNFPGVRDGVKVSGYYEYFDMMMDLGNMQSVLDVASPEPVLQAAPVEYGTEPAASNGQI